MPCISFLSHSGRHKESWYSCTALSISSCVIIQSLCRFHKVREGVVLIIYHNRGSKTFVLAVKYFVDMKVDYAVIEVGLGGRLDSTNVITPLVSMLTNIGFDHTQFLGNTLPAIAFEKAGIIKKNVPAVIGETQPETTMVYV
ncbi:MAG: hypothetical protein IKX38_06105, partial [Bacteroidales bacterium]|nr:hypothetical protein [Bacteroidales bacterium]